MKDHITELKQTIATMTTNMSEVLSYDKRLTEIENALRSRPVTEPQVAMSAYTTDHSAQQDTTAQSSKEESGSNKDTKKVILIGDSNLKLKDISQELDTTDLQSYSHVVVHAGTNDLTEGDDEHAIANIGKEAEPSPVTDGGAGGRMEGGVAAPKEVAVPKVNTEADEGGAGGRAEGGVAAPKEVAAPKVKTGTEIAPESPRSKRSKLSFFGGRAEGGVAAPKEVAAPKVKTGTEIAPESPRSKRSKLSITPGPKLRKFLDDVGPWPAKTYLDVELKRAERDNEMMTTVKDRMIDDFCDFLTISVHGPDPTEYNAEAAVAKWWLGEIRARRPEFND
ncbi:Hypp3524 [Branchiostoma lanceolatum]|uniref:Hypp3524 protein n=1 Tax=Branchiostoma lanceolatum TaxID=7740 RepID=A0A8K0A2E4_BRALA|nr:Hypp3524 [Branchiostoma lanceolatum]